jgi:hypothetical protein
MAVKPKANRAPTATRHAHRLMPHAAAIALAVVVWPGYANATHVDIPDMTSKKGGVYLVMPMLDAEAGKKSFVDKGCVACHAVNGVGGHDAPALDAHDMKGFMNPFEFAAKMWNHAPGMIAAQEDALGEQITVTGEELGNLIAFVHSDEVQHGFSEADLTGKAREMMRHEHGGEPAPEAHGEEIGHRDAPGSRPHGH